MHMFEHFSLGVKNEIEIKLISLHTHVILCICDNFHCFCVNGLVGNYEFIKIKVVHTKYDCFQNYNVSCV
jgi:hypothetical protein